jgi:hypothetical protein
LIRGSAFTNLSCFILFSAFTTFSGELVRDSYPSSDSDKYDTFLHAFWAVYGLVSLEGSVKNIFNASLEAFRIYSRYASGSGSSPDTLKYNEKREKNP